MVHGTTKRPRKVVDCPPGVDTKAAALTSIGRRRGDDPCERTDLKIRPERYTFGRSHRAAHATGIVVFAHGSGSSRNSRRRFVARVLKRSGLERCCSLLAVGGGRWANVSNRVLGGDLDVTRCYERVRRPKPSDRILRASTGRAALGGQPCSAMMSSVVRAGGPTRRKRLVVRDRRRC